MFTSHHIVLPQKMSTRLTFINTENSLLTKILGTLVKSRSFSNAVLERQGGVSPGKILLLHLLTSLREDKAEPPSSSPFSFRAALIRKGGGGAGGQGSGNIQRRGTLEWLQLKV